MKTEATKDCLNCEARCQSVFMDDMPEGYSKVTQHYRKGEILFHEGTPNPGVFCIASGLIKMFSAHGDGREVILKLAGPGDLVGHSSLSHLRHHQTSALAIEDTICCFIEGQDLEERLKQEPALLKKILERVEIELSEALAKSTILTMKSARERLANFFSAMAGRFGMLTPEGTKIEIQLTRDEIASYIGTAPETTIRFISEFKSLGLIREEEKHFYLLDLVQLKRMTESRF